MRGCRGNTLLRQQATSGSAALPTVLPLPLLEGCGDTAPLRQQAKRSGADEAGLCAVREDQYA